MAAQGHIGVFGFPAHGRQGGNVIKPCSGLAGLFRAIFVCHYVREVEGLVKAFGLQCCEFGADWQAESHHHPRVRRWT